MTMEERARQFQRKWLRSDNSLLVVSAAEFRAIRREALEEVKALAAAHLPHGEFEHEGRYDCIEALILDIDSVRAKLGAI